MKLRASKAILSIISSVPPWLILNSVEQATDELMQKIIREEFKLCTSIAIAHRLNTIMNFDRVIVLEGGQIVESGKPQDLLLRDSMFKQMWKAN